MDGDYKLRGVYFACLRIVTKIKVYRSLVVVELSIQRVDRVCEECNKCESSNISECHRCAE